MILQNSKNSKNYEPIKPEIESAKNTVKLFGITLDNKLNFEEHIRIMQKSLHVIKCNKLFTKIYG